MMRLACVAVSVGMIGTASANMPVAQYRRLDIRQRAVVDRAAGLARMAEDAQRNRRDADAVTSFRAAAQEWKRFQMAFPDAEEDAVAYAHLMEAYSLHRAGDRHQAVKLYTEVVEFYPDTMDVHVTALFRRGLAHSENGDIVQATANWEAAADVPGADGHPLAVEALERLADSAWRRGLWDDAAAKWEDVLHEHPTAPSAVRALATKRLALRRGAQGQWDSITRILADGAETADSTTRRIDDFMWNAWHYDVPGWLAETYFRKIGDGASPDSAVKKYRADMVTWYAGLRTEYEAAGKGAAHAVTLFDYRRRLDHETAKAHARHTAERLRAATLEPAEREHQARRFIDTLLHLRMRDDAQQALDLIANPVERLRQAYTIAERSGEYAAAELALLELENRGDPQLERDAKRLRAYLYKDRMSRFDDAVQLFNDAVNPPESLRGIQECFRRAGKKEQAQSMLDDIAAMYPDDAARAVFTKAEYFRADNNTQAAIAQYRRILANPAWRTSGEASRAHQILEAMGVETGGGVLNQIN